MTTKITDFGREQIQSRLEEEVKGMAMQQRVKYLSCVASVYLEELSNHYDYLLGEGKIFRNPISGRKTKIENEED